VTLVGLLGFAVAGCDPSSGPTTSAPTVAGPRLPRYRSPSAGSAEAGGTPSIAPLPTITRPPAPLPPKADLPHLLRPATRLTIAATIIVASRYDVRACSRAVRRMGEVVRGVSDTWRVMPMVNAR
jgi:hypothetical protein